MNFEEFKYLINRITILSDRCAGLKTQNKTLQKTINELKHKNMQLEAQNSELGKKLTELNHEYKKLAKEHEMPNGFHGKVNIKEVEKND